MRAGVGAHHLHVLQAVDDELEGLLHVAHTLQQKHHFRNQPALLTHQHGVLERDKRVLLGGQRTNAK